MTARKKKPPTTLDMSFEEAITRFARTKPGEVADAIAKDLADRMRDATKRVKDAREDISRGARSSKERFRI
jgi:hypothetical protein